MQHSSIKCFGFYLKSWTDSKQSNEAFYRNSGTPYIDGLELAATIYKNKKTGLGYMTAAP